MDKAEMAWWAIIDKDKILLKNTWENKTLPT